MTRVVVPYLPGHLHRRVPWGIAKNHHTFELRKVSKAPGSYRMLLEELFADMAFSGEPLVIVEHDIELRSGVLADFDACPEPWCFHAYPLKYSYEECVQDAGPVFAPFGCTRFRPALSDALASLPECFTWNSLPDHNGLDRALSGHLAEHGYVPHRHPGEMLHWHDYGHSA